MPKSVPRQVQFTAMRKEDLQSDEGVSFFNQQMSEIVRAINQANGTAGQVVLNQGVDVAGSTVTGLGAPSNPTDAVSLGHANGNYGPAAVGPQLDLGGSSTLKGLSGVYLLMGQSFSGKITLAKLTGGGSEGSITVVGGLITEVVEPT
jgi:hypothetical protein